jgi:uncharacterized coiled-coil protein SlyX
VNFEKINGEKLLAWVLLASIAVGAIATWSKAFDRIEDHEKRITAIESSKETLNTKLTQIQTSVDYLNWRMDAVTKQLEKKR